MLEDIKDSIKARLYDMKYTPFLTTYGLSWVYFNAKVFLIYFDEKLSVTEKIQLLSYDDVNYCYPLGFALFYVFVFPVFQWVFYWVTLFYNKKMNDLKQKREDERLLSIEESRDIRYAAKKLQDELDEYIKKYENTKKDYDEFKNRLEKEYKSKEKQLDDNFENKVKEATKELEIKLHSANTDIVDKNTEIEQLKKKLALLESTQKESTTERVDKDSFVKNVIKQEDEKYSKLVSELSVDEIKVLNEFYKSDKNVKDDFKKRLVKELNIQMTTSEQILRSLVAKELVVEQLIYVSLTDMGLKAVNELFKEKN